MHRFSDFAQEDEKPLDGEKVKLDSVLNKEISIIGYKIRPSKYKDRNSLCATVQFSFGEKGERKIFFTGSEVLIGMLKKYEREIPFLTVIEKIDKYYTFS